LVIIVIGSNLLSMSQSLATPPLPNHSAYSLVLSSGYQSRFRRSRVLTRVIPFFDFEGVQVDEVLSAT